MREVRIGPNEAGWRLDKFLNKYLREAGNGFLYKMLRKKNITLNGHRAEGGERLAEGDVVRFFLAEETLERFRGQPVAQAVGKPEKGPEPAILYEDAHILLVDKPQGMLSQKAAPEDHSLNDWLLEHLTGPGGMTEEELRAFRPAVCNRLDRNTSGLVICGRSLAGSRKMSELLRNRSIRKFYRLMTAGEMKEDGIAEGWLTKDGAANRVKVYASDPRRPDASMIRMGYRILEASGGCTYLEAELFTGKSHQIRAQMAALGYPLLGDGKYGNKKINDRLRAVGVRSQMLHAFRLEFPELDGVFQDLSGRCFSAPEPEAFGKVRRLVGMRT